MFNKLMEYDVFSSKICYYATNEGGEYGVYNKSTDRYNRYDFVCPELNLCIEFHGDHYHGNPMIYSNTDVLKGKGQKCVTAEMAWERDRVKNALIENSRGYHVYVVWELDWDKNQFNVIERILNYVSRNK